MGKTWEAEYRSRYRRAYAEQAEEKILTGKGFLKYLERLCGRYCLKRECRVKLGYVKGAQWAARTDGDEILINAANPVTGEFSALEMKASSIVGLLVHEIGHVNYSDFSKRILYGNGFQNGEIYPSMPVAESESEKCNLEELKKVLEEKDGHKLGIIRDAALTFHNMLEDMYIEARMCACFGGIVEKSLRMNNLRDAERAQSIRTMTDSGIPPWKIMDNVLLQYLFTGTVNDWEGTGGTYLEALERCRNLMDKAVVSTDTDDRFHAANQMLVKLWPLIRKRASDADNSETEHPGYEGDSEETGWNHAESGRDSAAEELIRSAVEILQDKNRKANMEETARAVRKIRKDMADEEIVTAMEEELAHRIAGKAEEVAYTEAHKNCGISVIRMPATEENIRQYELCKAAVASTVKRLMLRLDAVLEYFRENTERGMPYGKHVDGRHLYRKDKRIFMSRNRPCERKNVAVAVVMDESGSMSFRGRIDVGRFLALVLYEFCSRLDIPVLIMGHSTGERCDGEEPVEIYSYAEFDSVDQKDRYRLMEIRARGNNRDGAALQYAGKRLEERTEEQKLLFVVTDGIPCAKGYTGAAAQEDVRKIKKGLENAGIRVIATAIGNDREEIRNIYGEGFLNISDMKMLPDTMASLIAGYMER